jgi:hypothetical protein
MIHLTEKGLRAESKTTVAEFEGIRIVSIKDVKSKEEFLDRSLGNGVPGFELHHGNDKVSDLGVHNLASSIHYHKLTDTIAEIVLNDWECDLSIKVSIDESNDDILIEPSAWSMQPGMAGIGMLIAGIKKDLQVVGPFQQGARLPLSHPQMKGKKADWPNNWEAGILVFEGKKSGFSVQTWDSRYIFKGVRMGHQKSDQTVSFITQTYGPFHQNKCAGNVCWRISAFKGDWKVPLNRYREWYWKAYDLDKAAAMRPEWASKIKLAISWCPSNIKLLDALKSRIDPSQVFIHLSHWRDRGYDQEYPDYRPSKEGTSFIRKARSMGFHVAPHCNASQMSPDHPLFFSARDFCTRFANDYGWGGWSWLPVKGWKHFGPPQSYSHMPSHKDWNILVNVHLAWSPWRRELTRRIAEIKQNLKLDSVFVDVSQNIHNSDNAVLESLTLSEGNQTLIRELAELGNGFCVSGEARNEISTQFLTIVQFHNYNWAHAMAMDEKDVSWVEEATIPFNEYLFKGLARGIGYNYSKGENRMPMIKATLKQGAIPTLIFQTKDPVKELKGKECTFLLDRALG